MLEDEQRNHDDIALMRSILSHPNFTKAEPDSFEAMLSWLLEVKTRTLTAKRRSWAFRVNAAIRKGLKARGSVWKEPWQSSKSENLAPWMNDPSLLPKKPPGRRVEPGRGYDE